MSEKIFAEGHLEFGLGLIHPQKLAQVVRIAQIL
jgi:hypothetical protein